MGGTAAQLAVDEKETKGTEPAEGEGSMAEFHGGGDDVGLEETLGSLKEDPPAPDSILATISPDSPNFDASNDEEVPQEIPSDEELDEELEKLLEGTEIPDELTDEEAAAEGIAEDDLVQEEKEVMHAAPKRASKSMAPMPEPKILKLPPRAPSNPSSGAPDSEAQVPGELTMTMSGNMKLTLRYAFNDQEVELGFVNDMLQVSLGDGTELRVPLKANRKRAR